jgi:gliding motility associated protien GldN
MKKLMVLISVIITLVVFIQGTAKAQNNLGNPPLDGVYNKSAIPNRLPIPYEHLREADVMWAKRIWRVIDFRQKINLPLYYPMEKQAGRQSLMQVIYNAVMEGTITAYGTESDEFLTTITVAELTKQLNKSDTQRLTRGYPPYDEYDTVISEPFRTSDVSLIRVKEDWFFDKQRSVMDVRILGLCPIMDDFDPVTGDWRGYKPLFWVYFPECRTLFARYDVFNRWNDAERRSFDDMFWKRTFGSYIYKESNVYDRKIVQYAKNLDGLLEAERVKDELFKVEHDLWEY